MQNAWVELPEATWTENAFLGVLRLALIPASPDTRGAQNDKSEIVLLKIKL